MKTLKITKEQILNMERATRRTIDIEMGNTNFKHKVHKNKKAYSRSDNKKVHLYFV